MATPVITPAQVRAVSFSGAFDTLTDAQIQTCIDVTTLWYGAVYLETLTGTPNAILYSVAHLLWIQIKMEEGGPAALTGVSNRALAGVGSRGFAVGSWGPAEFEDWTKLPSPWGPKLSGILKGLPPAMTTTGAGAA